jgi:hypothetical protein
MEKMTIPQNELEASQNAPLFLPRYLQKQISTTSPIPSQHLEIIQRWQELMADKTRKHLKGERKLEGDLTTDYFVHILGWQRSTSKNPTLNSQCSIVSETRTPILLWAALPITRRRLWLSANTKALEPISILNKMA